MIGCSGGGGHNTAIQGLCEFYASKSAVEDNNAHFELSSDQSISSTEKLYSPTIEQIKMGLTVMYLPIIGDMIRKILSLTPYPVLPDAQSLKSEIQKLEINNNRQYVDMLLDVYGSGYYSVAIWNVLQKNDETDELKKLIRLQPMK